MLSLLNKLIKRIVSHDSCLQHLRDKSQNCRKQGLIRVLVTAYTALSTLALPARMYRVIGCTFIAIVPRY